MTKSISDLEEIIACLPEAVAGGPAPNGVTVIVGPGDDAGVYSVGGTTLVETVDVIAPVVDDPFTFGAVSANNSLSDVYAMGGRPLSALAIMGFPSCDYDATVAREVLKGAVHSLTTAGALLMGGHSFDDPALKFGLSVTGVIEGGRVLRVSGAEEGDVVVLTKPLGIGILTTAVKGGKVTETEIPQAVGTIWVKSWNWPRNINIH